MTKSTRISTAASWLVPVLIFGATVAAFFPALHNGFVLWDDEMNIVDNSNYRGLGWPELRWMFTTFHAGHYQPLSWFTLGGDYLLWGMNPAGYHLTNVVLHAAGAVLFYFVAARLLRVALPAASGAAVTGGAAFAALFFSIHPLRVESVAWATERRDVLSGVFLFAAVLAYLGAGEKGPARRRRLAAAVVFYILSLLSKASGMTLPVVLVVLDIYPLRRLPWPPRGWFAETTRHIWLEKIPFFIFAAAAAWLAVAAQRNTGALLSVRAYGVGRRFAQVVYALFFYPWKTVAPTHLSPIYELPLRSEGGSLWLIASAVVLAAVVALLFSLRKKYPALAACAVCYLVLVAPVSGVAQSGIQFVADRYSYLSCLSWALLAAGVAYTIQSKWKAEPVWIAAAAILLSLGGATWKQTEVWRDSATLWRQAIAFQPKSSFAHYNLGLVLFRQGDIENAKLQYEEALRLNPFDAETQNDLGLLLATRGEMDEALRYLQAAVHSDPSYAKPYYNIGRILLRQGRAADAVEYFTTALRLAPGTAEIHENLGRAYALQGRREEAIGQFEEAVRIMKARAGADVGPRQP